MKEVEGDYSSYLPSSLPAKFSFPLHAHKLESVYKGTKKLNADKLFPNIHNTRIFMLRSFERAFIGTGILINHKGKLNISVESAPDMILKRGIQVIGHHMIKHGNDDEIGIILYNTTQYLAAVHIGEVAAICRIDAGDEDTSVIIL